MAYSGGGDILLSSLLISFRTMSASESRTLRRSLKTPILWHILYSSSSCWTRFLRSFRFSFSLLILSSFSLGVSLQLRSFLDFFPISIIGKGSSRVEFSESCWANFLFCSNQLGIILEFFVGVNENLTTFLCTLNREWGTRKHFLEGKKISWPLF